MKNSEESLWQLYAIIKINNICIMGIAREDKEKDTKVYLKK